MLAGAFILCWAPYAVLAVMAILGLSDYILPLATVLPHQMAKSSVIWNTTLLVILNPMVSNSQRVMRKRFISPFR